MRGVAGVSRGERVVAFGQVEGRRGVALGVERNTGNLPALVTDDDCAGGRLPVLAGDGDAEGDLGTPALVAGLRGQRGLRGHTPRVRGGERQRRQRQRDAYSCNQLKPQTAADKTSHVHLLQIS